MQEESACNQGPVFSSNMDVNLAKNRGLLQATSNADNKNVRGKLLQVLLKFTYSLPVLPPFISFVSSYYTSKCCKIIMLKCKRSKETIFYLDNRLC